METIFNTWLVFLAVRQPDIQNVGKSKQDNFYVWWNNETLCIEHWAKACTILVVFVPPTWFEYVFGDVSLFEMWFMACVGIKVLWTRRCNTMTSWKSSASVVSLILQSSMGVAIRRRTQIQQSGCVVEFLFGAYRSWQELGCICKSDQGLETWILSPKV